MKKTKKKKTKKKEEKNMGIMDNIMGLPEELQGKKDAPKPKKEEHKEEPDKEELREIPLYAAYDEMKLATVELLAQIRDELVKMNKFFEDSRKK